ncbi:hypothetical protein SAMN04487976_11820 [Xaviernesmea oryzae]|nr:hypothetical protein SAMN04487976_11820 [Xaviernesmea oryzae]
MELRTKEVLVFETPRGHKGRTPVIGDDASAMGVRAFPPLPLRHSSSVSAKPGLAFIVLLTVHMPSSAICAIAARVC